MALELPIERTTGKVVKDFAFDVFDYGKEFTKGFIDGGIERPLNGIGQVVSLGHLPQFDLVELDPHVTGGKLAAQKFGNAAGMIFDYILVSAAMNKVAGKLLGAPAASTGVRLTGSAMSGFVSGAVFEPLKPGESQWNRLANGTTQAVTFTAMDAFSGGLASKFGAPTFMNSVARGGLSGFGAGVVHANADSLTHGRGFATTGQMLNEGITWGAGGAIMSGISYGVSRFMSGDRTALKGESRNALTAEGQQAKITVRNLENGKTQIESVELPNGTRMMRQGTGDKWVSNSGTPNYQEWSGDIRLSAEGKLQYVYRYAKAPTTVTVEVRLPDGSRVALTGTDGKLALPGTTIDATSQTLSDGAISSLKKLNIEIPADRLKVEGVTAGTSVSTNYSVELTAAEAAKVRQALATSGAQIVSGDKAIAALKPVSGLAGPVAEGKAGEFVYDRPMSDHTSTVAFMFKGDDQKIKVLTGTRNVAPFQGKEALPGGFANVKGGAVEHPVQSAAREMMEETGLRMGEPTLVRIGDSFNRDVRNRVIDFQWGIFGNKSDLSKLAASDDLGNLAVKDVETLLRDPKALAFDHHAVLTEAYRNLSKIIRSGQAGN